MEKSDNFSNEEIVTQWKKPKYSNLEKLLIYIPICYVLRASLGNERDNKRRSKKFKIALPF